MSQFQEITAQLRVVEITCSVKGGGSRKLNVADLGKIAIFGLRDLRLMCLDEENFPEVVDSEERREKGFLFWKL